MAKVIFNVDMCKGCQLCTTVCPKNIVVMSENTINKKGYRPATVSDMDKCIGCGFCATMCPDSVITVER